MGPLRVRSNLSEAQSLPTLDSEVVRLKEEVRALQWLARRKEQEWDQLIRLLKQKEEQLLKTERSQVLANRDAQDKAERLRGAARFTEKSAVSPSGPVIVSVESKKRCQGCQRKSDSFFWQP